MANQGNYQAAVDLFTQAINLDAKDFRYVTPKHGRFTSSIARFNNRTTSPHSRHPTWLTILRRIQVKLEFHCT